MDTFVKSKHVSGSKSHLGNKTAADRAWEYPRHLYEDGVKLLCRPCNVVIAHQRKSMIDDHLKCNSHLRNLAKEIETAVRQTTLTSSFQRSTESRQDHAAICHAWVKMYSKANIPLEKSDNPAVKDFLLTQVRNRGAISCADRLRRAYLPDYYASEKQRLKETQTSSCNCRRNV
ncbi:CGG triplet repeat-binding protein 1 isoform X1 [Huso huso]|uniref:CGG triplet repeat-binding protein 1 isoform X1 n=1 Tax=Huso huso TaxID=61971 RepID=A0ABR0ZGZ8_HUSHU